MRDVILSLIIFGSLPIILVRPFLGIIMWSWVAYMVPHKLTWGFAFNYPFAQAIAIATLAGWLLSKERKTLPINAMTVLLLMLTAWVSLTTVFAIMPDFAYGKWERSAKILLMTFVTIPLLVGRKRIDALVWVIALSVGFYGIKGGLFLLRGAGDALMIGPAGGFFGDNNAFALTLIMVVPLMRYLQMQSKRLWIRLGLGAAMLLSLVSVVGTHSRGGFLAAAAMCLTMVMMSRRRVVFGSVLLIGVIVGIPFLPGSWVERMETIQNYEEDGSAMGRIDAWTFAWRHSLDRPIGGGFLINRAHDLFISYVPNASDSRAFHSVYFEVLGEHGFIGLGIFLALLGTTVVYANAVRTAIKGREDLQWADDLVRMLLVCMVGYAVGGAFLNLAFFDLYYHLIALILCTKLTVEAELGAAAKPRDGPALQHSLAMPRHE